MPAQDRPFLRPGLWAGLCAAAGAYGGLSAQPGAWPVAGALLALLPGFWSLRRAPVAGPLALALRRASRALLFLAAGILSALAAPRAQPSATLSEIADAGETVRFAGRLAEPPQRRLDPPRWGAQAPQPRLGLVADLDRVERGGGWKEVHTRVLLSADDVPMEAGVGDEVEGRVWLRPASPPANPGQDDREARLRRAGVGATGALERGSLAVLRPSSGFARRAEAFRGEFAAWVRERLGDRDRAALVAALAVGERGGIATELTDAFNASGLAHVLSISGLHLAVAVAALAWLLRRLFGLSAALSARVAPRRLAAAVALPLTVFYVALIGAPPPAVRAGLGLALVLGARLAGRSTDTFNTLGWALCAVALADPRAIDLPSTQMSFVGVAGLAWITPRLREWIPWKAPAPDATGLRAWAGRAGEGALLLALGSVAATLATAPLTALYFERASLVAAAANLVAWPASTLVVPAGAAGAALYALHPPLAGPLVDLAGLCAGALAWCARAFGEWPAASLRVAPPSATGMALYAVLVVSLASWKRWPRALSLGGASVAAASLLLVSLLSAPGPDGRLEVAFLSVGQGDSTVVRFPGGATMVVDAGGDEANRSDPGARVVAPFLRERGARRIDVLVATHGHPDHVGGLAALVERFPVGELWVNERPSAGPLAELARAAERQGARVVEYRAGLPAACEGLPALARALPDVAALAVGDPRCSGAPPSREIDGVRVEVLHPLGGPDRGTFPELAGNDNALVLRLTLGSVRVLLAGDIEREGEALLLARGWPLQADVLKAPHHGSPTSSTDAFVAAAHPAHVVFPVGIRNRWGFPSPAVVARYEIAGARVHRTDVDGAVTFRTDGRRLEYRHHLASRGASGGAAGVAGTPPGP